MNDGRLLVHALAEPGDPEPPGRGVGGRELVALEAGGVVAWATIWETSAGPPGRIEMLAHHAVVEALWRRGAVLPVRFPTWSGDAVELAALLRARSASFAQALVGLREHAELALTVQRLPAGPESVPASAAETARAGAGGPVAFAGAGRRYMHEARARAAERERREEDVRRYTTALDKALGALLVDCRHKPDPDGAIALSSALLVRTATTAVVRGRVAALAARWPAARALVNGPWPPYSFVPALDS